MRTTKQIAGDNPNVHNVSEYNFTSLASNTEESSSRAQSLPAEGRHRSAVSGEVGL